MQSRVSFRCSNALAYAESKMQLSFKQPKRWGRGTPIHIVVPPPMPLPSWIPGSLRLFFGCDLMHPEQFRWLCKLSGCQILFLVVLGTCGIGNLVWLHRHCEVAADVVGAVTIQVDSSSFWQAAIMAPQSHWKKTPQASPCECCLWMDSRAANLPSQL